MDPESLIVGVVIGLAPGLVLGVLMWAKGLNMAQGMIKEFAAIGKQIASAFRAPSGGGGGLMGLVSTVLPFLTKAGGPK